MKNSKKKAQLEISFNWIFVLIAGAAILFFFIKVIGNETDFAKSADHSRAVSRMNSMLTALQQNPDSISKQPSIGYQIEFFCNEVEEHEYGIRNANTRETLPHQLVFTPQIIGESRLLPWVRTLDAPFPVSSILYLTDEKTKYVFISNFDDDGVIEYYYNQFPRNISKEYIEFNEFQEKPDEGYTEYIVVAHKEITGVNFGFTDPRKAKKVKNVIEIDQAENKIIFHEFKGESFLESPPEEKFYFDDETAIGAIITGRPDLYECVMKKALEQIRITTDLNLERIKKIRDAYGADHPRCYAPYAPSSQEYFSDLSNAAKNENIDDMMNYMYLIEALNNQLISSDCVLIY